MAENKKSFILYCDQKGLWDKLSNEQAGLLIKHVIAYVNDENPIAPDFITELAFEPIKASLKRDLIRWDETREKRVIAGQASAEARRNKSQQVLTRVESVEHTSTNSTVSVNVNGNVSVNGNVRKKSLEVSQPPHPLITWIQTNTPKVQKLKQPLTNDECTKLLEDLKIDTDIKKVRLKDMLTNMQNYKPLLTKNESANLTIRNWWKREMERETPTLPLNAIKMNDKPYTR